MELIDLTQELAASETAAGVRYRREEPSEQVEATVAVEHFMDVYVNDLLTMKLVCSPWRAAGAGIGAAVFRRDDYKSRGCDAAISVSVWFPGRG